MFGESGVAIGSEISGGVENVTIIEGHFYYPIKGGIRIKSGEGRGGYVKNINFKNIYIKN